MKTGPESDRSPTRKGSGLLKKSMLALTAALLVSACQSNRMPPTSSALHSDGYRSKYPITLADAPVVMDIPVGYGKSRISSSLKSNIRSFAADAVAKGTGEFVILTPSGAGNDAVAASMARDIAAEVEAGGMPRSLINNMRYPGQDVAVNAPIRLGYTKIRAVTPPCGQWNGDILPDEWKDGQAENFGCASQANLAAMVSDPMDLIQPRAATGIPSWRRWFMFGKYEAGESPSGKYEDGKISAADAGGSG